MINVELQNHLDRNSGAIYSAPVNPAPRTNVRGFCTSPFGISSTSSPDSRPGRSWCGVKKPRILYIIWSLDLGGAEQVVVDLAKNLDRNHFELRVLCLNDKGRNAVQVEQEGITVSAFHKRPKLDPFLIPRIVRFLKREKIDLVHTHLFTANLWGRIAAALAGIPSIATEHGMDVWRSSFDRMLDAMLLRLTNRMVYVSEGVRNFYRQQHQFPHRKTCVVYNGIDVDHFRRRTNGLGVRKSLGIPANRKVIGIVGRLVPEKAHKDFIQTMAILVQKEKNVTGLIIGEGPLRENLEKAVVGFNLSGHIFFTGYRQDTPDLYQAMDAFVLCSSREGFPVALLEAMAAGIPVVATDVGGVKECVDDGETGLLVAPGKPRLLAEAIMKILDHDAFRHVIVRNAARKIERCFSLPRMIRSYECLYDQILAEEFERRKLNYFKKALSQK